MHEFNQRRLLDRSRRHNSKNLLLKLLLGNHSALLPLGIKLLTRSEIEVANRAISAAFSKINKAKGSSVNIKHNDKNVFDVDT